MFEDWPNTLNLCLLFSGYFKILKGTKTKILSVICCLFYCGTFSSLTLCSSRTLRPFSNTAKTEATHKIINHKLWIFCFLYLIFQAVAYYSRSVL